MWGQSCALGVRAQQLLKRDGAGSFVQPPEVLLPAGTEPCAAEKGRFVTSTTDSHTRDGGHLHNRNCVLVLAVRAGSWGPFTEGVSGPWDIEQGRGHHEVRP